MSFFNLPLQNQGFCRNEGLTLENIVKKCNIMNLLGEKSLNNYCLSTDWMQYVERARAEISKLFQYIKVNGCVAQLYDLEQ